MEVGCYKLTVYCDNDDGDHPYNYLPHIYRFHTYGRCKHWAQYDGWLFKKDGSHLCPLCSGKKK